jgi:nucleoside-diphosphate-sugar epimerase
MEDRMGESTKKVIVTGGSGLAGRAVVRELLEHGYEVDNIDLAPAPDSPVPFTKVDLTDFGQTVSALRGTDDRMQGAEAVVHFAAVPGPGRRPDEITFEINTISTYNVFRAATHLGIKRVVWASSETTMGLPFDRPPPYVPLDEEAPVRPEWSYSLSKVLGEEMARQFSRWYPEIPFVGLRISKILEPRDYSQFPDFWDDPLERKWNLWSYVDVRDVAQAARLGLEAEVRGAETFVIAAADTVMNRPNRELMAEVFPGVPIRDGTGDFDTLLSIAKARRVLGYAPRYSWREQV